MEIAKKYIWQILLLIAIVIIFLQRSYNTPNDIQKVEVTIPKSKGEIKKSSGQINYKKKDSIIYRKGQTIYTENEINRELAESFKNLQKENDSLALFKKYVDAIQIKEQLTVFDNKDLTLKVKSKVQGQLLDMSIAEYTKKEQKVKIDVPIKTKTAVYAGAGVLNNKDLNNFAVQAEVGLQIKRDIISITADTQKNFGIKYLIKL